MITPNDRVSAFATSATKGTKGYMKGAHYVGSKEKDVNDDARHGMVWGLGGVAKWFANRSHPTLVSGPGNCGASNPNR
jgi:hypothetical protein